MLSRDVYIDAFKKGMRVDDLGNVYGVRGGKRKLKKRRYENYIKVTVNHNYKGTSYPLTVSRMVAFQKYGEALFEKGIEARHLDNNSTNNRIENIAIGTHSQNIMDIPREQRVGRASLANRKHSDGVELQIYYDHSLGLGYKRLSKKYNIPKSTIRCIVLRVKKCA